jgi:hypothetical protein
LDLLAVKKLIDPQESKQGKESLQKIVSMLVGLIRSNSTDRLHDAPVSYRVKPKKDYD